MALLTSIVDRLEPSPDYVCEGCGLSDDTERLNCHACGYDVVAQNGR